MKFIVSTSLIALLAFALGLFLPWWSIAMAAFVVTLIVYQRPGWAFLAGFTGIFLLWFILAFSIDAANNSILSERIARVLPLGGSVILLMLLTAFTGAIVGGFAALTASLLKKLR